MQNLLDFQMSLSTKAGIYIESESASLKRDILTHKAYWEYINFEDPCAVTERYKFGLCGNRCPTCREFCEGELWHTSFLSATPDKTISGGHLLPCKHYQNYHFIFLLDGSHSIRKNALWDKVLLGVTSFLTTRKQQNTNDYVSLVVFDDTAVTLSSKLPADKFLSEKIPSLSDHISGKKSGTKVSLGLKLAEEVLNLATDGLKVLLLILSDGDISKVEFKESQKQLANIFTKFRSTTLDVMTLGFGQEKYWENLENLATTFNGKFHRTPDTLTLNNVLEEKTLGTEWSVGI